MAGNEVDEVAVNIPCPECLECPGRLALIGRPIDAPEAHFGCRLSPLHVRAPGMDVLPLSAREVEVLTLVAEGKSNKLIARALKISDQTVKNHMTSILRKLGVNDRTQAVVASIKRGWIVLD